MRYCGARYGLSGRGIARSGFLPIVHSFACFLTSRANEQIYNNATERTKIIYVGSLAGAIPGGPGHSHQSVRDISAMSSMPGMVALEPMNGFELDHLFNWVLNVWEGPAYIRLCSVPFSSNLSPGEYKQVGEGIGHILREGKEICLFTYGPIMTSNALVAAELIEKGVRKTVKVISSPWLNIVDSNWLQRQLSGVETLLCMDNHSSSGGQADCVLSAISSLGIDGLLGTKIGVDGVPQHGTESEVLNAHLIDPESIANRVLSLVV